MSEIVGPFSLNVPESGALRPLQLVVPREGPSPEGQVFEWSADDMLHLDKRVDSTVRTGDRAPPCPAAVNGLSRKPRLCAQDRQR